MKLTRRHLLAGTAGIATAPLLPSVSAQPAAPMAEKQAPSFYRYKVGDVQVNAIFDGSLTFDLNDGFVLNAKKDEVNAALDKAFLPQDKMTLLFTPLAINIGGKTGVIDTGMGGASRTASKGQNGQFVTNLVAAGIDPKSVDMVVISHFHGDHINGLLNADNTLAFPNAEVMVPAVEWKYFMDDGEMSRAPEGRMQTVFKNARRVLRPA
jgi:glyoxylase-like metal-dependent hydrolase (beta-lactamase superfamily II)